MIRKRLNRNIVGSAIVDLPEIDNELQQIKNDTNTNTQNITQIQSDIQQIESEIGNFYTKQQSDDKFALKTQIDEANTQINQNQQDIGALQTSIGNVYTKSESDSKYAQTNAENTFSTINNFNNDTYQLQDKKLYFGGTRSDLAGSIGKNSGGGGVKLEITRGNFDITLPDNAGININNKNIGGVANPNNPQDAATKSYVDGKSSYITKTLNDFNYKEQKEIPGIGKVFFYGISCDSLVQGLKTLQIKSIALESVHTTGIDDRPVAISFITFKDAQEVKISIFDLNTSRANDYWNSCNVRIGYDLNAN